METFIKRLEELGLVVIVTNRNKFFNLPFQVVIERINNEEVKTSFFLKTELIEKKCRYDDEPIYKIISSSINEFHWNNEEDVINLKDLFPESIFPSLKTKEIRKIIFDMEKIGRFIFFLLSKHKGVIINKITLEFVLDSEKKVFLNNTFGKKNIELFWGKQLPENFFYQIDKIIENQKILLITDEKPKKKIPFTKILLIENNYMELKKKLLVETEYLILVTSIKLLFQTKGILSHKDCEILLVPKNIEYIKYIIKNMYFIKEWKQALSKIENVCF